MARRRSVLFVCVGNACRSQMAEAFARRYGADVVAPASAGIAPAMRIPDVTQRVMRERNIEMDLQYPKPLEVWMDAEFDLVVNISGYALPRHFERVVETWEVDDPIGHDEDTHRRVRDEIEGLVMRLILATRTELGDAAAEPETDLRPATILPPPPVREPERLAPESPQAPRRRKFLR